ncbi:MAG: 3,4-dihydroxy-2-butanone-4-phosphate synthase [Bdellovibrionaceae bacterium]|nr:3,4-dihydroxy-2-butanone-4-phosphate synthase [Pseudobdellovibrionaceae bacterium]
MSVKFNTPEELIEDIRQGKIVILVDDEDRENEGDLILAADFVTTEAINFMAREARGLICLALASEQIERLKIPQMVNEEFNDSPNKTAFTVSIEASFGVTTGISAADRAHTVRVASNPNAKPSDLHMPGHIFPIRAQKGGVLKRAGHTEGSVDLSVLAGLQPAAVICEVMNDDGTMARVPDLMSFAEKHKLKIGTIVDLIEFRLRRELLVEEILTTEIPWRGYRARVFKSKLDGCEHLVLQKGEIVPNEPTLVRVQLDSYTRDLMQLIGHGGTALEAGLNAIDKEGRGCLVLLRGKNRAEGLAAEIQTWVGERSVPPMDERDYGIGAQILRAIGAHQIRLLTNTVEKRVGLKAFDLEIVDTLALN